MYVELQPCSHNDITYAFSFAVKRQEWGPWYQVKVFTLMERQRSKKNVNVDVTCEWIFRFDDVSQHSELFVIAFAWYELLRFIHIKRNEHFFGVCCLFFSLSFPLLLDVNRSSLGGNRRGIYCKFGMSYTVTRYLRWRNCVINHWLRMLQYILTRVVPSTGKMYTQLLDRVRINRSI